jgi:hypothetical protein
MQDNIKPMERRLFFEFFISSWRFMHLSLL